MRDVTSWSTGIYPIYHFTATARSRLVAPITALHQLLADHLNSECRLKTNGRGRTADESKPRIEGADNHWLDCLVGCAVAASAHDVELASVGGPTGERKQVRISELQARKRRSFAEKYADWKRNHPSRAWR